MRQRRSTKKRKRMETFGTRLKQAMSISGHSVESLSKKLKVSPQIVRKWLRSTEPAMSAVNLIAACRLMNVRPFWLIDGELGMIRFVTSKLSETEMLAAFRALSDSEKILFRNIAGVILRSVHG